MADILILIALSALLVLPAFSSRVNRFPPFNLHRNRAPHRKPISLRAGEATLNVQRLARISLPPQSTDRG